MSCMTGNNVKRSAHACCHTVDRLAAYIYCELTYMTHEHITGGTALAW
jgi:hypothetical protein